MIGHIKPKVCKLPSGTRGKYMNLYCSICHSLRFQFGVLGTLFVNNELAIILLALRDYFAPVSDRCRCPAKGFLVKKPVSIHRAVHYAARLSFLLGWLKVSDWEADSPALYKKLIKKLLDRKAGNILAGFGQMSRDVMEEYHNVATGNCGNFLNVRRMSYLLSKSICVELGKQTSIDSDSLTSLSELFGLIGELVAIADPLIDLKDDIEHREYNPIRESSHADVSMLFHEYEFYRLEYHHIEERIRNELDRPGAQNVMNDDLVTTLQHALDRLSSRIVKKRAEFFDSGWNTSMSGFFRMTPQAGVAALGDSGSHQTDFPDRNIMQFARYGGKYGNQFRKGGTDDEAPQEPGSSEDSEKKAARKLTSAEKEQLQEMIDKHGRQKPEFHDETCWYGLIPLRWCAEGGLECCCCLGSEGCGDCAGDGCECCCDC